MIVEVGTNSFDYDEKEWAFIIPPCACWQFLAIRKSKEYQFGKCPICGQDIYLSSDGRIGGHL